MMQKHTGPIEPLSSAITTMSTVGYGDICPESNLERAVAILAMCIGGAFYGYIVASIASILREPTGIVTACMGKCSASTPRLQTR